MPNLPAAFSILTSDRLTATASELPAGDDAAGFQYPDLGSFDCNLACAPHTDGGKDELSVS